MNRSSDPGPFVTAVLALILPLVLAIALLARMPVTLITTMAVIVPLMTFATLCVAISMAWAFMVAAKEQTVRHLAGTMVAIALSMLIMIGLTLEILRYSAPLG